MTKKPNKVDKVAGKAALFTAYCTVFAETVQHLCMLPQMGKTVSAAEVQRNQDRLMQHWGELKDLQPAWDGWIARRKREPKPEPITRYHFPDKA